MTPRALLAGLGLALLAASAAQARTVVVVLDRSGSLRYADPQGEGPRRLAVALALGLEGGDTIQVLATRGDSASPRTVGDPASLAGLLGDLLTGEPWGGADLLDALAQARQRAGAEGLVVVFTDDDLDVVGAGDALPPEVLERARAQEPHPARDDLNRAARELLQERWSPGPALVALRAPLPAQARATPFLEALGAQVVELGADPVQTTAALLARIRGDPLLAEARQLAPGEASLSLPYPARVVLTSAAPWQPPGATPLDVDGRAWLASGQQLQLGSHPQPLTAWIAPQVGLPDKVLGFRLRQGGARLVLPAGDAGPGKVVARAGEQEAELQGEPPQAALTAVGEQTPVTVLRVLDAPAGRVVTARRQVPLARAELQLQASGDAAVGGELRLEGVLPVGFPPPAQMPIRVREGGGALRELELQPQGPNRLAVAFSPRLGGPLQVESQGELFVSLAAPVEIEAGVRHKLTIARVLGPQGKELTDQPLEIANGQAALQVELTVEPPLETPRALTLELGNAPAQVTLEAAGPISIQDQTTVQATLRWPVPKNAVVSLRVVAQEPGPALRAIRPLGIHGPPDLVRRGLAIAAFALSFVWFLWLVKRFRARRAAQRELIGQKQLRGIGPNGKISVERYFLRDYAAEEGPLDQFTMGPLEGGVEVGIHVRRDGSVKAVALPGTKLVHADRPELLGAEITLIHANAFALVRGHIARRYVYLEGEPSADELQRRYVEGTVSYEADMRDSGVFVVLDDEQNVPAGSDHDLTVSQELFVSHESLPRPSAEEALEPEPEPDLPVRPSDEHGSSISDEGILYMDSTEAEILDSDDQIFLSSSERISREDGEE